MFDLSWIAVMKDKSFIRQYDGDGTEHKFKEVLDRQEDLEYFSLLCDENQIAYVVDLKNGSICFVYGGQEFPTVREDHQRETRYNYRLIYFKEVERSFNSKLEEIGEPIHKFFIGFQYLDENGKNHKRIIKIHPNGVWVIN